MFLNSDQISEAIGRSAIDISPFEPRLLKPASYVLRLGGQFRRWKKQSVAVDLMTLDCSRDALSEAEPFEAISIAQGDFYLISSLETIRIPEGFVGFLATTSHMARAGVSVTCDSSIVSPGFGVRGCLALTFEVVSKNPSPVILRKGLPVCHLMIAELSPNQQNRPLHQSVYESRSDKVSGPAIFEELSAAGISQLDYLE